MNASTGIPGSNGSIPVLCRISPFLQQPHQPESLLHASTLTCSLDRFMARGRFCSSWLPSWPSSGGMTLEGGWGSPHGSLPSSISPALASTISISGSRTGYFCPCMQTMVCEGRNQSKPVSINLKCSFQVSNDIDNRSSR